MREVGAFEAKNKLGTLLDWVEKGEEVIITRHGKAVARLIPNTAAHDANKVVAAAKRIRSRAEALKSGVFDWREWKGYRDEGRA
ncbi:type II toxin-antitoxin system Phd/YefM family antitoxin [Nitrosovibrio sp. Nv17]|jgi:prevent-host-death family protein|uniref:type II toxin-antitoxin system Phd/YefM family antitoxin n=1 Tax=Nitrosovibrio sp. Nv17 TaxID=1855339 RepID=UPI000908B918|nr:type II toxin-antitoxin system prevent-host-death family antitoxin [Nitrosovibrio sp. Nv17]SFW26781.1 prevent-host-death family protein [Nitrosovibrio sp. Nv17]